MFERERCKKSIDKFLILTSVPFAAAFTWAE